MAAYSPGCMVCRDRDCPGCIEDEPENPDLDSLEETPEGQGWKPDGRDATPEPPAYLDPLWVLKMRRLVRKFAETGILNWNEWRQAA
jgi:hypothetical protein